MVFVKLSYGPYKAHGVIRHRNERLNGVVMYLNAKGYEVEIAPVNELNRCAVEVRNMLVFQCDIRNLLFRTPYLEDPVAKKLIEAVELAAGYIYSETNVALHHIPRPGRKYVPAPARTKDFLTDSTIQLLFEVDEPSDDDESDDSASKKKPTINERTVSNESEILGPSRAKLTFAPYSSKAYIMLSESLLTNESRSNYSSNYTCM